MRIHVRVRWWDRLRILFGAPVEIGCRSWGTEGEWVPEWWVGGEKKIGWYEWQA